MRDATIRILTSAAAALLVYVAVTAVASLPLWARLTIAAAVAIVAWFVAGRIGASSHAEGRRVASGIRGRQVTIDRVTTKGANLDEVASDIKSAGQVEIRDLNHRDM